MRLLLDNNGPICLFYGKPGHKLAEIAKAISFTRFFEQDGKITVFFDIKG
ncbi:hypothetical protein SAMN05192529_10523 [Arachidicoccus rhizosphaerae]|uniref:Uncharacterized protein n=1 Tax=Arachidicoccus rhizosphaerae TaxID=551991 RepID=A0A1H3XAV8_9BACT|nr:hypothetical protein [Arachidicoccus rhizosphaerae]SDZ95698.1 hypothetical protein SAMN05192529_10523 [Arachidicoccus rhizosphaerae]